jgi:type II secretory pathway pseudopilin PulG
MDMFFPRALKGFSLIELVVIILIIAILAIVVSTNWPGVTLNLGAQTEQLATDLRYTQALAMTQGQRYCLLISANTYTIINSTTSTSIKLALGNTTVTLGNGITFGAITPASTAMFVFDGKGVPYYTTNSVCNTTNAQAATTLTSTGSIPLTASAQTRTITLSPETGRVLVQ